MPKRYFEDFTVGQILPLPERQVGRAEMIAFAAEFDPQPFHLDERARGDRPRRRAVRLGLARLRAPDADALRRLSGRVRPAWARPGSRR